MGPIAPSHARLAQRPKKWAEPDIPQTNWPSPARLLTSNAGRCSPRLASRMTEQCGSGGCWREPRRMPSGLARFPQVRAVSVERGRGSPREDSRVEARGHGRCRSLKRHGSGRTLQCRGPHLPARGAKLTKVEVVLKTSGVDSLPRSRAPDPKSGPDSSVTQADNRRARTTRVRAARATQPNRARSTSAPLPVSRVVVVTHVGGVTLERPSSIDVQRLTREERRHVRGEKDGGTHVVAG
jgi:hypothetical protein